MPFTGSITAQDRPVPEGHARIARRFNAGNGGTEPRVPKGRLNLGAGFAQSAVPSGLDPWCGSLPTLKRWAIVKCPFGTGHQGRWKRQWA